MLVRWVVNFVFSKLQELAASSYPKEAKIFLRSEEFEIYKSKAWCLKGNIFSARAWRKAGSLGKSENSEQESLGVIVQK